MLLAFDCTSKGKNVGIVDHTPIFFGQIRLKYSRQEVSPVALVSYFFQFNSPLLC